MIRAKMPIIYAGRQYNKGDALPGNSPLTPIWLKNGAAYDDTAKSVKSALDEKPVQESVQEPESPKKEKGKK